MARIPRSLSMRGSCKDVIQGNGVATLDFRGRFQAIARCEVGTAVKTLKIISKLRRGDSPLSMSVVWGIPFVVIAIRGRFFVWTMMAALATSVLGPRQGVSNNTRIGSSATASRVAEIAPSASWGDVQSRLNTGMLSFATRCAVTVGFQHILSCRKGCPNNVRREKEDHKKPPPIKEAITTTPDCGGMGGPTGTTHNIGSQNLSSRFAENHQPPWWKFGGGGKGERRASDNFAKSAVESVRSRLSWWRKRAREHKISPCPVTWELC